MRTVMTCFTLLCAVGAVYAYSPIIDGAMADMRIKVVDDKNEAVSDASVSVTFYISPTKVDTKRGKTDAAGCFVANGRCIGEVHAWIRKDGYYDAKVDPVFRTSSDKVVEKSGKWSDGTVETTAILKKKRNPIDLKYAHRQYWAFPATNETFYLDLELCKWCPPFGNGKNKDMALLYEAVEHPEAGWGVSYWNKLTLSLPNVADGFYAATANSTSQFPFEYEADCNATYVKSIVLERERKDNCMIKKQIPADGEYFIFRTRTMTNSLGKVTSANYGRIGEKLNLAMGLSMECWFNSTDNDTNLEAAK